MIFEKGLIFRKDRIIEICTGKSVLHLGFIQHSHLFRSLIENNQWLHGNINAKANRLVGIDYLEKDVNIIRKEYNYECYACDVMQMQNLSISEIFDVVVCGELIEHLENPGLMLDGIKRFMSPESLLIITTPNPWALRRINLIRRGFGEEKWLNPEHTCWFTYCTLSQLLRRKGFQEVEYDYYFMDNREDLYNKEKRYIFMKINYIRNLYRAKMTNKVFFSGLFFTCKLNLPVE